MSADHKSNLLRTGEPMLPKEFCELVRVQLASAFIKRDQQAVDPRKKIYTLFINDPSRIAAHIVAIPQFADFNRYKLSDSVQVILNQLPHRSFLRLTNPNKPQLHPVGFKYLGRRYSVEHRSRSAKRADVVTPHLFVEILSADPEYLGRARLVSTSVFEDFADV